jgi:hypothetical protein
MQQKRAPRQMPRPDFPQITIYTKYWWKQLWFGLSLCTFFKKTLLPRLPLQPTAALSWRWFTIAAPSPSRS